MCVVRDLSKSLRSLQTALHNFDPITDPTPNLPLILTLAKSRSAFCKLRTNCAQHCVALALAGEQFVAGLNR